MADVTYMQDFEYMRIGTVAVPTVRLSEPSATSSTSLVFDSPITQEDGTTAIAKAVFITLEVNGAELECYIAAGGFSDSQHATITTRQTKRGGLDITTADTTNDFDLPAGTPVKAVISSLYFEQLRAAMQGDIATGGASHKVGKGVDEDITVYAFNADASKPYFQYDSATNQWLYSNDGTSSTPFGTGAGLTGGDGITIAAGDVDIDLTDTVIFKAVSAGVGDAGKAVAFDADGYVDSDSVQYVKDLAISAAELNQLDGISADVTDTNLNTLTAGAASDADALHTHKLSSLTPKTNYSTIFEATGRLTLTRSDGTGGGGEFPVVSVLGLYLETGSGSYGSSQATLVLRNAIFANSPVFSAVIVPDSCVYSAPAYDPQFFCGISTSMGGNFETTGLTLTQRHIGFLLVSTATNTFTLYASTGNNSAGTQTSMATGIAAGSIIECFCVVTSDTTISFYYRIDDAVWSAATVVTTTIPAASYVNSNNIAQFVAMAPTSNDNPTWVRSFNYFVKD